MPWGSFKGDEDAWMERYFDAFPYVANWGTHVLKLRLPSRLLGPRIAKAYCGGGSAFVREKSGNVILSFVSEDEAGGVWVEGEGEPSSLISVRAELARGDLPSTSGPRGIPAPRRRNDSRQSEGGSP